MRGLKCIYGNVKTDSPSSKDFPLASDLDWGESPIRVNLGPLPAAVVKKRAIILSGAAIAAAATAASLVVMVMSVSFLVS
jgi:hypothetical protein